MDYATYVEGEIQNDWNEAEKFWEEKIEKCTAEWEENREDYLKEFGAEFVSLIENEGVKYSDPEYSNVENKARKAAGFWDVIAVPEGYLAIEVDGCDLMFKKPYRFLR